jgi:hypothetical protein
MDHDLEIINKILQKHCLSGLDYSVVENQQVRDLSWLKKIYDRAGQSIKPRIILNSF